MTTDGSEDSLDVNLLEKIDWIGLDSSSIRSIDQWNMPADIVETFSADDFTISLVDPSSFGVA